VLLVVCSNGVRDMLLKLYLNKSPPKTLSKSLKKIEGYIHADIINKKLYTRKDNQERGLGAKEAKGE